MFRVIGNSVSESGFKNIVFQASACPSGSINSIMIGSHYNRASFVHNILPKALERLLLTRFLCEVSFKNYFISVILKHYFWLRSQINGFRNIQLIRIPQNRRLHIEFLNIVFLRRNQTQRMSGSTFRMILKDLMIKIFWDIKLYLLNMKSSKLKLAMVNLGKPHNFG